MRAPSGGSRGGSGGGSRTRSPGHGGRPEGGGIREKIQALRDKKEQRAGSKLDSLRERLHTRLHSGQGAPRQAADRVTATSHEMDRGAVLSKIAERCESQPRTIDNAAIKEARAHIKGWRPDEVRPDTRNQYQKMTERMHKTGKLPEQAAGTTRAFYTHRAALVHTAKTELRESLTARDRAGREQNQEARHDAEKRIGAALAVLERYPPGSDKADNFQRTSLYTGAHQSEHSNGKREALSERAPGWRDRVFAEVRDRDKDAVAVAALTGTRPAELVKGVQVEKTGAGLRFTIQGAKVDDATGRGQQSRTLEVSRADAAKSAEGRHLLAGPSSREVRLDSTPGAFAHRVERASIRAGEERPASPYDYRHAFADRARSDGAGRDELAAALGHRSEASQSAYGAGGGSGGGGFARASASRPTRA